MNSKTTKKIKDNPWQKIVLNEIQRVNQETQVQEFVQQMVKKVELKLGKTVQT